MGTGGTTIKEKVIPWVEIKARDYGCLLHGA